MSWVTHVRRTQNPQNTQSVSFSASSASSALIVVAFVIAFRGLAYAQSAVPAQGPMTIERVHSGFVVAPDVKVTEVDNTTSALAGAYAGWLTDDTFFIGGGGYWLANPDRDRKMAYGGLVLQWLTHTNSRVGFGAKALIGGGQATLETTVSQDFRLPDLPNIPAASQVFRDLDRLFRPPPSVRVRHDEGFFVAEPQVDLIVKLARQLRLNAGVGYRLISTEGRNDRRLRGATGSVALQIGGGS
jgi:hypothetical protein